MRFTKFILLLLFLLPLSCLSLFCVLNKELFYSDNFKNYIEDCKNHLNKKSNSLIKCGETLPVNFIEFGDDICVISRSKFMVLSKSLKKIMEFNHNFNFPVVKTSKFKSLIFDANGKDYTVMTKSKILNKGKVDQKIITGEISERDNLVLVTESDEYCCEMRVLSSYGKDVYQYCFAKSYVTDVAINDKGDKVAICGLKYEDNKVKSTIQIFDFQKEIAIYSQDFDNNVFVSMNFFDDENLMAIGDNLTVSVMELGNKTHTVEYINEDLCLYSFDKNFGAALSFSPTYDGRNQYVVLLNKNCQKISKTETDKVLKSISLHGKTIFALSESQLLTLKRGKIDSQKLIPITCQKVIYNSHSNLFALGNGEVALISRQ